MSDVRKLPRATQVVIVGAGASGLQASQLLRKAGYEVVILEARDRIGGRICTTKHEVTMVGDGEGGIKNVPHDEGAAWVHGLGYDWPRNDDQDLPQTHIPKPNPMLPLLEQVWKGGREALFKKELRPAFMAGNPWMRPKYCAFDTGQLAVYCNGQLISDNKLMKDSLKRHWQIMDEVDGVGQALLKNDRREVTLHQSLCETLERVMKKKHIQRHKKIYGKGYKTMEQLRQFYVHLIEIWYAGPSSHLQLSEFMDSGDGGDGLGPADSSYTCEGDFYGPHCYLNCGMQNILKPLVGHGEEILMDQEVVKIREAATQVLVETRSGETVRADCCIVTIPVACLKTNTNLFEPKLSIEKQESVDMLRVGGYKKVLLTFDRIFWPLDQTFVGFLLADSNSPLGTHLLADNLWAAADVPLLEIVLVSDAVVWATGKSTEEIRDEVLRFLAKAMNMDGIHEFCIDCHVTRWEEDPYSRGAYSTFGQGCDERHAEYLRKPEWGGKLVLAGEHTIAQFEGSAPAALFSGASSSKSVIDYLCKAA